MAPCRVPLRVPLPPTCSQGTIRNVKFSCHQIWLPLMMLHVYISPASDQPGYLAAGFVLSP
eukprot:1154741-Pelagomonas_calceolata.AAC.4